jgi:cell division protein ZapA (FtsZ GTPase activity inhibitor)
MLDLQDEAAKERISNALVMDQDVQQKLAKTKSLSERRYGTVLSILVAGDLARDESRLWYISVFEFLAKHIDTQAETITALTNKLREVGVLKERLEAAEKTFAERQEILEQARQQAEEMKKAESRRTLPQYRYVT